MAKATYDIPNQIPTRPFYAGVGVTDLVVETVRDAVADVQKRIDGVQKAVTGLEVKPEALRDRATKSVSDRIDSLNKDAQARRRLVEQRVADLQSEVQAFPTRLQKLVDAQVSTAGDTYADRQQATQDAEAAAKTTVTKAKTTKTQAEKQAKTAKTQARTQAKKTAAKARKSPAKSSAKATTTAAKKTATATAKAVSDAAEKVGD